MRVVKKKESITTSKIGEKYTSPTTSSWGNIFTTFDHFETEDYQYLDNLPSQHVQSLQKHLVH